MSTPLQTNTDKLTTLKEKANNLPDQNPPAQLQEKTVTPTKEGLSVVPDSGIDGMSKVTVNGDSNLVPENIKEGVSIFGVEGNVKPGEILTTIGIDWNMNDDGTLKYTDIHGESIETALSPLGEHPDVSDIDFSKDIIISINISPWSGYEITISFIDGKCNFYFHDKSFGPT